MSRIKEAVKRLPRVKLSLSRRRRSQSSCSCSREKNLFPSEPAERHFFDEDVKRFRWADALERIFTDAARASEGAEPFTVLTYDIPKADLPRRVPGLFAMVAVHYGYEKGISPVSCTIVEDGRQRTGILEFRRVPIQPA